MIAKIWRNRIIGGTKTYAQCPASYKEDVLELLKQDVVNETQTYLGKMTPEIFYELTGIEYEA